MKNQPLVQQVPLVDEESAWPEVRQLTSPAPEVTRRSNLAASFPVQLIIVQSASNTASGKCFFFTFVRNDYFSNLK